MRNEPSIALFDFDGTITHSDSFTAFLRHSLPPMRLCATAILLLPTILGYKAGLVSQSTAKEAILYACFRGGTRGEMLDQAAAFTSDVLPGLLRPAAIERIREHRKHGHRVLIVTASIEEWMLPWCDGMGLELIATNLEYNEDGRFTGSLATPNCSGPEKVRRIRQYLGDMTGHRIYAYGDSKGDREMLALADEPFWRPFE